MNSLSPAFADWSTWQGPSEEALEAQAHLLLPSIKWLHPEIVGSIAAHNTAKRADWVALLSAGGVRDIHAYLWPGSPCAFPGVRRASGNGRKTALDFTKPDCLCTDGNSYPNRLWEFVMGDPAPVGRGTPREWTLAHLFPSNSYTFTQSKLWQFRVPQPKSLGGRHPFAGLYTSAANTFFMHTELVRPTDFQGALLHLILQKSVLLYSKVCTMLPYDLTFNPGNHIFGWNAADPKWDWDDTGYGDLSQCDELNAYRLRAVESLVSAKASYLTAAVLQPPLPAFELEPYRIQPKVDRRAAARPISPPK